MRLARAVVRGFRNLEDLDIAVPGAGAVILGANGQGKTNLLEALCYPVLFRSFRGAADAELVAFGGAGFRVALEGGAHAVDVRWTAQGKRKEIAVDGEPQRRLADAVGRWLAVAFRPADVALAAGAAAERRFFLDRLLSLASPAYLAALTAYRQALQQRNSALRGGQADLAALFDTPLARHGAVVVAARVTWVSSHGGAYAAELDALGERAAGAMRYRGHVELSDEAAWPAALAGTRARDLGRGSTGIGPHRDDLALSLGGRDLRSYGSTGQQRSAAIALKLLELDTLDQSPAPPVLLLDDVFAELDDDRQARLTRRLLATPARQVFLTAPRAEELPAALDLPVWTMREGRLET